MDIGRLCIKKRGREKGRKCAVIEVIDDVYVLIDGPEVKRRRCNINHLEPLNEKLEIQNKASDNEINQFLKESVSEQTEETPESEEEGQVKKESVTEENKKVEEEKGVIGESEREASS